VGAGVEPWSYCLSEIARVSRSRAAVVQVSGLAKRNLVQLEQVNIEAEEIEEFGKYYLPNSPRLEYGNTIPLGQIFSDYDFISESEMDENEYYADFLAKWGFRYCAGGAFLIGPDLLAHFSIQRTRREGHVDDEQIRLLERLLPHVKRAMELEWRFRAIRYERDGAVDALDRLAHGVILVAATGQIVRANQAAERILSKQDGLLIEDSTLCAATQPDTHRLHSLIGRVAKAAAGESLDSGDILSIARSSSRQPLAVSISPLPIGVGSRVGSPGPREAGALLFVHDPETSPEISSEILQGLYGLTPAEVRLAAALVSGARLKAAAERFGISPATARTQLKAIFGKTGTHRQADLIRLILSGPAATHMP
jgi:DNA-binding CsgD family transcriptional regulator/PAS domain-containing protein